MLSSDLGPEPPTPAQRPFGNIRWPSRLHGLVPPRLSAALVLFGVFIPAAMILHVMGSNTPVWITDAVGVTALLRNPPRVWPGLILVVILADSAASTLFGEGLTLGVGGALCDSFDVVVVSVLLHSMGRSGDFFSSLGRISKFAAVCAIVPAFSGVGGAAMLHVILGAPCLGAWENWYLSSVFGLLIVTPFLLLWTEARRFSTVSRWHLGEIILLAILVGCAGSIDFGVQALPGLFLSFPFLLLAAFRGGLLGTTSASVTLVVVATWLTMTGHGEIATHAGADVAERIVLLQFYFAVVLLSSLPVAVMLEQRKLLSQFKTMSELSRMARHDLLTGLPNRLLFNERLAWMRTKASRQGGFTALLMLDLDKFKPVNDLHGHAAGDRVLVMVADRLRGTVREADSIARLGGDEFAIVGHVANPAMAQNLAQRVIAALSRPFSYMDLSLQIGCSIGIALDLEGEGDAEILVQQADTALYQAKENGRNGFHFFEPGMDDAVRRRAEMEAELRRAILLNEVAPRYQPIVALSDSRIVGFEMLARWHHPTLGDVSPSVFVALAEGLGLIGVLSEQLTRKACLVAMTWPGDIFVTVNVSPLQLRDRALPVLIRSILADTGLSPLRFEIELTESALITDFKLAHEILLDLKSTGIRLTLDDFGTGYSSLRHLQSLPLDKIKIDTDFVSTMRSVSASRKIVAGVIGLGHSLGLPVVAEGIEDAETAAALQLLGCDLGQGWLYGRAMTADAAAAMLKFPTEGEAAVKSPKLWQASETIPEN
jgi:diguanylate cyclase (GGDEF)-like protein